ncbi:MAG: S41 family peptidase [Kiritimatiellia bacterium]
MKLSRHVRFFLQLVLHICSVAALLLIGSHCSADDSLEQLYLVLHEHGIGFDTNAVVEAALAGAVKAIDPGARITTTGEVTRLSNVSEMLLKREEWAEGIGYLKLAGLFEPGKKQVMDCLRSWVTQKRRGIILDLRGAGGDDLNFVDQMAGFFVASRTNLYEVTDSAGRIFETHFSIDDESSPAYRPILIILVDGSTTGASELFAAALQKAGGVLLIGRETAGDNAIRKTIPIFGSRVLEIATHRVVLCNDGPYGKGRGVTPDIAVAGTSRREPVTERSIERYDRKPSEKAKRDLRIMQRVADDPVLGRAADILLALAALEVYETGTTTNSLNAQRL